MIDKIVKYIELAVPTWPCNFRCTYCYVGQHYSDIERGKVQKFQYTPEQIANALSRERLGGTALMNFCANGETLILPSNLEYIKAILAQGHFVMVVTNMTQTKALKELCELPAEWRERLFLKCSFHWLELKRLNMLDMFVENVQMCWGAGISLTIEITPHDELIPEIPEVKEFSLKHFGALPHITIARDENNEFKKLTKLSDSEYEKVWGQFDSDLFKFKSKIWGRRMNKFCYAGAWTYSINIADGGVGRCSYGMHIGNLFKDKKLPIKPMCKACKIPHCYNGHSWVALGCITDIETPTYAQMRDRVRQDGSHWLYPRIANVFSQKLYEHNKPWGLLKRVYFSIRRMFHR